MHFAAEVYFNMDLDGQKQVQVFLCKGALEVREGLVSEDVSYRESVTGSTQVFDAGLHGESGAFSYRPTEGSPHAGGCCTLS